MRRQLNQVAAVLAAALTGSMLTLGGTASAHHDSCGTSHDMGSATSGTVTSWNRNDWWASTSGTPVRTFTLAPTEGDADLVVYGADCATELCRSTAGSTAPDSCTTTALGLVYVLVYYYSSPTYQVPYTLATSGTPMVVPNVQPTSAYPSHDCASGTALTTGFVGDNYVTVRALRADSDTTWVCARVDGASTSFGGKLVVDDPVVTPLPLPRVDSQSAACSVSGNDVPGPHPLFDATTAGVRFMADTYASSTGAAFCLQAGGTHLRAVVPVTPGAVPQVTFLADRPGPYAQPTQPEPIPSGSCQAAPYGTTRIVDLTTAGTRAYLYVNQAATASGTTISSICLASRSPSTVGGVLTLETNTAGVLPTVELVGAGACPDSQVRVVAPSYLELKTGRTTNSIAACLLTSVATLGVRFTTGALNAVAVSWEPDPDSAF